MKIISLGWGTQSFALAAMSVLGEIEPVDAIVHSDTTHEASWTYSYAKKYTKWLKEHGQNVITVKPGKDEMGAVDKFGGVCVPAFTHDGFTGGQLRRQCTNLWKIRPMRRWLQEHRNGERVELWLGISMDEIQRMKPADVKYIEHRRPLIEMRMSRHDCMMYLQKKGLDISGRSACTFCPFHSFAEWREIKQSPKDWNKAVEHDEAIRKVRPPNDLFVCNQMKPLTECRFDNAEDKGQMIFNWQDECTGYCGT